MARNEAPPFERGEYQTSGDNFATQLGKEWVFEDINWGSTSPGVKTYRSGKKVTCRLVKNGSTAVILPKHLVRYSATAGEYGEVVNGDARTTAEDWAGVADEFLPAAGVPVGAYFFIVVNGPSKVITPDAGGSFNGDIAVGQMLVAATAAASTGTTSGRVQCQNITGGSQDTDYTLIMKNVQNALGRALSAATTANTATDILADIGNL